MRRAFTVPLLRRTHLADEGIGSRALRRELDARRLIVVRPGVYAWAADADPLTPEERIVVRARALQETSARRPVFSHLTAAALHDLPVYRPPSNAVHVVVADSRSRSGSGVVRHDGPLQDGDVVEVEGMLCTAPALTVADVARTTPFATGVCVADAALRKVAYVSNGDYRHARAEEFGGLALGLARRRVRGVSRATRVLDFADGRAQLPGESVSRIHLVTLGFAPPRLQVPVPGPFGMFWIDFGLDDVGAFGEFDGKGKYRDELLRSGRTIAEVIEAEKQREDWVRGTTQRRLARWGGEHIGSARALGVRLASFGIVPPGRR